MSLLDSKGRQHFFRDFSSFRNTKKKKTGLLSRRLCHKPAATLNVRMCVSEAKNALPKKLRSQQDPL